MLIQVKKDCPKADLDTLKQLLLEDNFKFSEIFTQEGHYLITLGKKDYDLRKYGHHKAVSDLHRVTDAFQLVSSQWKTKATAIDLGDDVKIGGGHTLSLMAGPCSIEGEEQIESTVAHLKAHNIKIMRGGVFKPRSSPYSFRGLGIEGLKSFYKHCRAANIKIITEVMQVSQIAEMHDYVDIFQVGARNSQNFNLLDELGKINKPILLKRGLSGTIEELLQSAEYIFSNGNEKIMLCERGIRSYEKAYRNTMDINAISILKAKSHLPVIADPSHGVGLRKHVVDVALASIMAGADGLITEVHEQPEKAFSDGQQNLNYTEAASFYEKARKTFAFKKSLEN